MSRARLQVAHLVWWAREGGEGQPFIVGGPQKGYLLFCTPSPAGADPRPAHRSGQGRLA